MMVLAPMLLLGTSSAALGPCDIFAAGHTPCVAAHSVVRALYSAYNGPLYAVRRRSDNRTLDVRTLGAGGVADSAAVDAYCGAASNGCTIAIIYDQSPQGNHLQAAPGRRGHTDIEVNATHDPLTPGGGKRSILPISKGPPTIRTPPAAYRIARTRKRSALATATTTPPAWPKVTSRRRCTWSQAASITTRAAASTYVIVRQACFAVLFLLNPGR